MSLGHPLCRLAQAAGFLLAGLALAAVGGAARAQAPPGWGTVYDFLVQDVCLDASGHVILGATPADGTRECPVHRNLRIGENLPYHKHDWPKAGDRRHPGGYSQNDTFPVSLRDFGTAVLQARSLNGRAGGGLIVFSGAFAASAMTLDPTGFQVFYGPDCGSPDPARQVENGWIFVGRDFAVGRSGSTIARLTRYPDRCPRHLARSYTQWYSEPVTLRVHSAKDGVFSYPFVALISDHFGGRSPVNAKHLERFYFTRELGLVRWERWQNAQRDLRASDTTRSATLGQSGRCDPVGRPPAADAGWVMVGCRQWTNIVVPSSVGGDRPDTRLLAAAGQSSIGRMLALTGR